jgi:DNA polymerase-3 subunit delta'
MKLIGHKTVQDFFSKVIQRAAISHAYIFIGPRHVGKETCAVWVASELLHCPVEKVSQHPDVRMIRREYDEKNNRYKRDLSVENIREAVQFAVQSPFYSNGYKIIIISEADRLNDESANALLKMLEEPPERTIFFLLYETNGAVMPTISSRAQTCSFIPVSLEELERGLREQGLLVSSEMLMNTHGLPGLAISWLLQPEMYHSFQETNALLRSMFGAEITYRFSSVEPWFAAAKEDGGVDALVEKLTEWYSVLEAWLYSPENAPATPLELVSVIDALSTTISALRKNAHPPLAVQNFLIQIP